MENCITIGVDPGEFESGIAVIRSGVIIKAAIVSNEEMINEIVAAMGSELSTVVYENIVYPYKGMHKSTITTCKFIGVFDYLLRQMDNITLIGIERVKIRRWVYDTFPDIAVQRVIDRIAYLDDQGKRKDRKRYVNKDGQLRAPSFAFVDDRIVIAAMKHLYGISTPKPGKRNEYGLSSHSWQALAVASMYTNSIHTCKIQIQKKISPQTEVSDGADP